MCVDLLQAIIISDNMNRNLLNLVRTSTRQYCLKPPGRKNWPRPMMLGPQTPKHPKFPGWSLYVSSVIFYSHVCTFKYFTSLSNRLLHPKTHGYIWTRKYRSTWSCWFQTNACLGWSSPKIGSFEKAVFLFILINLGLLELSS